MDAELIPRFCTAFHALDADTMVACYAEDARSSDPVFAELRAQARADLRRCQQNG